MYLCPDRPLPSPTYLSHLFILLHDTQLNNQPPFMQTVWRYEVIWSSMAISLDGTSIFVNYLSNNSLLRGNFFNLWADPDGLCFKRTLNELCITGRDWQASTCTRHWTGFQQKISDCDTHTVKPWCHPLLSMHHFYHIYPVISCLMVWQCLKSHT